MTLRTFAIFAALAVPAIVRADKTPADYPPTNTPTSNAPTNNTPGTQPTPNPDTSGSTGMPGSHGDRNNSDRNNSDRNNSDRNNSDPSRNSDTSGTHQNAPGDTSRNNDTTRNDTGRSNDTTRSGDTASRGGKLNDGDVKIVAHLHHVNQMEITLARLAEKSGTARVKDYASTLLSDHQSNDKDLTAFAKSHKLTTIPSDKPQSDADRQDDKDMTTAVAHLKTLKGAEFDKQFLTMMQSDHDKELTKIDVAISGASDPDLKSLLQSTKPVLQRHADQARDLAKSPQASADMQNDDKLPSQRSNGNSGH